MNKLWYLRRLDLFDGLSVPQMEQLAALMRDRSCRAGEDVVVRPSGDRIYIIKNGRVRVLNGDIAVAVLGPGQMFGTSSLFGAATTSQRVIALDPDVLICDAQTAGFLKIMALHPVVAAKVMSLLARQMFELEQAVERGASQQVEQRLADLLLRLADRDEGHLRIRNLSQADLARMIGASREGVSRALARWEREGKIVAGQRSVEVKDETALRAVANEQLGRPS
jgi:CRP/FNR family cyclic AMP-dependent transcriptional regulator